MTSVFAWHRTIFTSRMSGSEHAQANRALFIWKFALTCGGSSPHYRSLVMNSIVATSTCKYQIRQRIILLIFIQMMDFSAFFHRSAKFASQTVTLLNRMAAAAIKSAAVTTFPVRVLFREVNSFCSGHAGLSHGLEWQSRGNLCPA